MRKGCTGGFSHDPWIDALPKTGFARDLHGWDPGWARFTKHGLRPRITVCTRATPRPEAKRTAVCITLLGPDPAFYALHSSSDGWHGCRDTFARNPWIDALPNTGFARGLRGCDTGWRRFTKHRLRPRITVCTRATPRPEAKRIAVCITLLGPDPAFYALNSSSEGWHGCRDAFARNPWINALPNTGFARGLHGCDPGWARFTKHGLRPRITVCITLLGPDPALYALKSYSEGWHGCMDAFARNPWIDALPKTAFASDQHGCDPGWSRFTIHGLRPRITACTRATPRPKGKRITVPPIARTLG